MILLHSPKEQNCTFSSFAANHVLDEFALHNVVKFLVNHHNCVQVSDVGNNVFNDICQFFTFIYLIPHGKCTGSGQQKFFSLLSPGLQRY